MKVNQQDVDRYGGVVGRVYTESLDVDAEQLKRGMAWIYRIYNRDRSLLAVEQEAGGEAAVCAIEASRPDMYRRGDREEGKHE